MPRGGLRCMSASCGTTHHSRPVSTLACLIFKLCSKSKKASPFRPYPDIYLFCVLYVQISHQEADGSDQRNRHMGHQHRQREGPGSHVRHDLSRGNRARTHDAGLVDRYDRAGQPPPQVMYVDRDCCGDSLLRKLFYAWPNMIMRLDIWHFMRRFSLGYSTDAHILYPVFMSRLSKAIFEWNAEDLDMLRKAKRLELITRNVTDPTRDDKVRWLTKTELANYCRRRTRGTEETTHLIGKHCVACLQWLLT
ncbi:hypothetical protein DPMN_130521 [Dreissena polymorpha]|uniref:Transposase n=1 Tax=Dreissena polymorpha TaxID=45954 RepID=A0A9D4H6U7_DREPO|nr:hypothetical protein DPMN_130521 [Dreissena polymorpha]